MIVFVIGCARSGTSILGELMGSHHKVFYLGERMQATWNKGVETGHHYMTKNDVTLEREKDIKSCFVGHESGYVVEKCPPNILRISFIHAIFPEAKFIHIIRDGRDVACSLLPGLANSWQHLKPPGWHKIERLYDDPLKRGAWLWQSALRLGLIDIFAKDHLQIKYEDLVHDPLGTAVRVFSYLKMVIDPDVVAFCSKIQNRTIGSYQAKGQSHWFRNNHKVRVGRWIENIPENQIEEVESLCQPMLERLGYD